MSDAYRQLERPLLLLAVAAPLGWLVAAALGAWGLSLGPNPVREIIHFTGKTALNLLLVALAVTPLREWTGWNRPQRWRRILGVAAFCYALLHLAAYAVLELNLDFADLGREIARRPYIMVGLASLLMLVPLAATSTDRAMRRMGRRWLALHRLAYPAALLAAWHFHWQVRAGLVEPLLYWAALGVLLGWRVLHARRRVTSRSGPATTRGRT